MDKFWTKAYYDYNIDNVLEEGNVVGENIIKARGALATNINTPITKRQMTVCYNNRPMIWMRDVTLKEVKIEIIDGLIWFRHPITKDEDRRGKEGSRFILHPDTTTAAYFYASPTLHAVVNYLDSKDRDESTERYRQASIIHDNIVQAPYTALITVLKRYIKDKDVAIVNNDVAIDGKKVSGQDQHINTSGVHIQVGVNYKYDVNFFKDILNEDEFHRKTKQGITGVANEIPNYSKEQFTDEWLKEIERLVFEAEAYLKD